MSGGRHRCLYSLWVLSLSAVRPQAVLRPRLFIHCPLSPTWEFSFISKALFSPVLFLQQFKKKNKPSQAERLARLTLGTPVKWTFSGVPLSFLLPRHTWGLLFLLLILWGDDRPFHQDRICVTAESLVPSRWMCLPNRTKAIIKQNVGLKVV